MTEPVFTPRLHSSAIRPSLRNIALCAHKNNGDPLSGFLRRHPFASHNLLEGTFGEGVLRIHIEKEAGRLREVRLPDLGSCFALKDEPNASLLGLHRRERARWFALSHIGPFALRAGISPGLDADAEFCSQCREGSRWWRVWVDMGGCAPEALPFVVKPPKAHGAQVRDIVLTTDPQRLDLLAAQIELNWRGQRDVQLYTFDTKARRTARPRGTKTTRKWSPPLDEKIEIHIRQRMRGSTRRSRLAGIAKHLSAEDWGKLTDIGNNPLFTTFELAYLRDDALRIVRKELERLERLEAYGLIKTVDDGGPRYMLEGRKVLTWRGIEFIAEHWGTSIDAIRRFHPWPLTKDGKGQGHVEYATRWAAKTERHQHTTWEFALALLDGARRVGNGRGEIRIRIDTTIASRIAFRSESPNGEARIFWVTPDARLQAEFWQHRWIDGERMPSRLLDRRMLLIEVDRETATFTRIANRLDRYAAVWHTIKGQRTALIWVVDGSPHRERQILDAMRKWEIQGWTSTLERLALPREDHWWLLHPPVNLSRIGCRVGLRWNAVGGMAPWRRVWMSTEGPGYQPLLGWEPS